MAFVVSMFQKRRINSLSQAQEKKREKTDSTAYETETCQEPGTSAMSSEGVVSAL